MMACIMANIGIFVATAVLQTKLAEPPKVESSYCRDFDTDPPVLTLIGPNPQTVVVGEEYFEHGAVAADNCGDFRVTVLGEVDVASAGEYEVAYEATDLAGNRGETLRLVRVVPANRGDNIPYF
jgi:hypothetical protein